MARSDYQAYLDLAEQNPYLLARKVNGYTQEELATASGVTAQYIRRQEQGLVNTPSATIDRLLGVPVAEYYEWVSDMRKAVEPAYNPTIFDHVEGPFDRHPFKLAMAYVDVQASVYFGMKPTLTSAAFSRWLRMHPRNWQLYLAGNNGPVMPPTLKSIMLQSPALKYWVGPIEEAVAQWLRKN